jgi:transposase-like protein
VASVSRELGVAESLLHKWKHHVVEACSESEQEVIALRRKLREVEMERDIPGSVIEEARVGAGWSRHSSARLRILTSVTDHLTAAHLCGRVGLGPSPIRPYTSSIGR